MDEKARQTFGKKARRWTRRLVSAGREGSSNSWAMFGKKARRPATTRKARLEAPTSDLEVLILSKIVGLSRCPAQRATSRQRDV